MVQIIVDSTVDLAERYRSAVSVVPLTVNFGGEEFLDGVTLTKEAFYRRLPESPVLPTTSQATPAVFQSLFEKITRAGDSAVVITIAEKLSGTYQNACIAAEDYPNIFVVDSLTTTTSAGILAEYAVDLARSGMDAKALADRLMEKRNDVCLIALLDTLEYLKRGGRISKAVALAGGLLSIKPVITISDGEIHLIGKARGSKQGNNLLVEKIRDCGGIDFSLPILLGYTGLSDELLRTYIRDSKSLWESGTEELDVTQVCSVIGTHVGPGAIVASFFRK